MTMHLAWVNLTNGGMSGGYHKYLRRIVPRLANDARVKRIDMFSPAGIARVTDIDGLASHTGWPDAAKWRGFGEAKRAIARLSPDVVFIPTARWLDTEGLPTVVMVRNMEPLVRQEAGNPFPERGVNLARMVAAKRACARAHRIIAVSDFVQSFLEKEWGIPGSKVARVYHGVDETDAASKLTKPKALEHAGSPDFLFVAGSIRPMRGIEDAIRALQALKDDFPALVLVIAGAIEGRVNAWATHLRRVAEVAGVSGRVIWGGKFSPTEMAWCFRHCRAFAMTSRVEACPNIALEAMSAGAPIISSANAPMPEFFRQAACYYAAGDSAQLADRAREILVLSRQELAARVDAGLARARDFRWDDCANRTLIELSHVAREPRIGLSRPA
jgi:glycosyltransferase involved in cell wall biosynthesis